MYILDRHLDNLLKVVSILGGSQWVELRFHIWNEIVEGLQRRTRRSK